MVLWTKKPQQSCLDTFIQTYTARVIEHWGGLQAFTLWKPEKRDVSLTHRCRFNMSAGTDSTQAKVITWKRNHMGLKEKKDRWEAKKIFWAERRGAKRKRQRWGIEHEQIMRNEILFNKMSSLRQRSGEHRCHFTQIVAIDEFHLQRHPFLGCSICLILQR